MKMARPPRRMHNWKAGVSIVFLLWSAGWSQFDDLERHVFTDSSGFTLPYRLLRPQQPELASSYPLVVFLHGGGDVGTDNESQLANFPQCFLDSSKRAAYPCYIIAPQCPSVENGWSSFPGFPNSIETPSEPPPAIAAVLALVDSLRGSHGLNIDTNRIYVTGLSLGGEGTFDLLTRRPELVAAAIPICGIGDTAKAYLYKDIPLWIFHGSQDEVNDVMYSRMIVATLISLGAHPKYTEYEGWGHRCWDTAYAETDLLPWLFAQNKHNQIQVLHPQKQTGVGSGRYVALRKRGRVELSWDSSVQPDLTEIYTPNGKMLHRYPIAGLNASTMSLPLPYAHYVLFVKFIKSGVTLHTAFISPVRF
jgi:poly(3-hydroxybutyrate) depolymerase